MQRILESRGIGASEFRARRLDRDILSRADLVITAEREHRAFVSRLSPEHATKSFTLRQLTRLLAVPSPVKPSGAPVDRVLAHAQASRGLGGPASGDDDIADPWGRRRVFYRRTANQLDLALDDLTVALTAV